MSIYDHVTHFGGLPVADLRPAASDLPSTLPGRQPDREHRRRRATSFGIAPHEYPPDVVAWRLRRHDWDDNTDMEELYAYFRDNIDTRHVTALVLGAWDMDLSEPNPVIDLLVRDADRFPALRHLFLGDVTPEESEISWTTVGPLTALLNAFPRLEKLVARGGAGDSEGDRMLSPVRHAHLRELRFESGGLSGRVVRAVGLSELPALESLEIWLGVPNYGGDATLADLEDILAGTRLPMLRHLGLLNSELQDEIAAAVAGAAVTARLRSLDLSQGVLGDVGVEALLTGQPLGHLRQLTVNHHFIGNVMAERLRASLTASGVEVVLSEPEIREDWGSDDGRYVAVTE